MQAYPFFSEKELHCRCGECDGGEMHPEFMAKLIQLRSELSLPMPLSSGYRCPAYNDRISHSGIDGPHTTGRAVDVLCSGKKADAILRLAYKYDITGKGIMQHGPHKDRFIHLDDLMENPPKRPRPWVWSY